jgi:hypothetical protein
MDPRRRGCNADDLRYSGHREQSRRESLNWGGVTRTSAIQGSRQEGSRSIDCGVRALEDNVFRTPRDKLRV